MEVDLLILILLAASALAVGRPALRHVAAIHVDRRARAELRAYVGRDVLADAAFKALLAALRRIDREPGIIDRVLGDTSERDRARLDLLREALGEQRLSLRQADAVLKLLPDARCNDEARALLRYSSLVQEEMLEKELSA